MSVGLGGPTHCGARHYPHSAQTHVFFWQCVSTLIAAAWSCACAKRLSQANHGKRKMVDQIPGRNPNTGALQETSGRGGIVSALMKSNCVIFWGLCDGKHHATQSKKTSGVREEVPVDCVMVWCKNMCVFPRPSLFQTPHACCCSAIGLVLDVPSHCSRLDSLVQLHPHWIQWDSFSRSANIISVSATRMTFQCNTYARALCLFQCAEGISKHLLFCSCVGNVFPSSFF